MLTQEVQLPTRKLRDLTVSAIGYGCMGLSHGYGKCPEHAESVRLIRQAYREGCTFFDTAEVYGNGDNEELVGEALEPVRDHVVIATKYMPGPDYVPATREELLADITKHLDASLKRLRTDHVELYYSHRVFKLPIEFLAWAMGELIKTGKIRAWGLSQVEADVIRKANAITPLTAVQSEYSIMERMFEKEVIPTCKELNIGFVPFSPLASGFLSGKYTPEQKYKGDDVRRVITRFDKDNMVKNQPLLDLLNKLSAEKHATPAQISLAWIMCKGDFLVSIPGMRTDARIHENLQAANVHLTPEEFAKIEEELSHISIYGNRTSEDIAKLKNMKDED